MSRSTNRRRAKQTFAPLPPDPETLEGELGDDADLYAQVRADTAAALGREDDARQWAETQDEIESEGRA